MREHRRRCQALLAVVAGSTALIGAQIGLRTPARADTPSAPTAPTPPGTPSTPSAGSPPTAPGTAAANAALLGVVPQASSLSLTTSAGQSESAYNQTEDQATSATIDMGGLGVLLENSPVCGQVFFTPAHQPQPLTADSQDGSRTLTNHPPNGNQVGNETVTVSSSPEYAQATTAPISQEIPGVLRLTGQTDTQVRYTPGAEQEADASVHADVTLLGGLVSMHGMQWQAQMLQGLKNSSTSTFSFGSVTLAPAGIPLTLPSSDSTAQVLEAVNGALGASGLTLSLPASSANSDNGSLSISPLDLHFSGSPTDNTALAPAAAQLPSLEQLLAAQTSNGSDCSQIKNFLGNMLTPSIEVANLALAAAQGAGGLDVDLGGATVSVQAAPDYSNPFGTAVGGFSSATPLPVSGGAPVSAGSAAVGASPAATAAIAGTAQPTASASAPDMAAGAPAAGTPGSATPANRAGPSSSGLIRCVTASPAGGSCWRGLGVVAGAAALAIGVALLAADLGLAALPVPWPITRRRSTKRRSSRRGRSRREGV